MLQSYSYLVLFTTIPSTSTSATFPYTANSDGLMIVEITPPVSNQWSFAIVDEKDNNDVATCRYFIGTSTRGAYNTFGFDVHSGYKYVLRTSHNANISAQFWS